MRLCISLVCSAQKPLRNLKLMGGGLFQDRRGEEGIVLIRVIPPLDHLNLPSVSVILLLPDAIHVLQITLCSCKSWKLVLKDTNPKAQNCTSWTKDTLANKNYGMCGKVIVYHILSNLTGYICQHKQLGIFIESTVLEIFQRISAVCQCTCNVWTIIF